MRVLSHNLRLRHRGSPDRRGRIVAALIAAVLAFVVAAPASADVHTLRVRVRNTGLGLWSPGTHGLRVFQGDWESMTYTGLASGWHVFEHPYNASGWLGRAWIHFPGPSESFWVQNPFDPSIPAAGGVEYANIDITWTSGIISQTGGTISDFIGPQADGEAPDDGQCTFGHPNYLPEVCDHDNDGTVDVCDLQSPGYSAVKCDEDCDGVPDQCDPDFVGYEPGKCDCNNDGLCDGAECNEEVSVGCFSGGLLGPDVWNLLDGRACPDGTNPPPWVPCPACPPVDPGGGDPGDPGGGDPGVPVMPGPPGPPSVEPPPGGDPPPAGPPIVEPPPGGDPPPPGDDCCDAICDRLDLVAARLEQIRVHANQLEGHVKIFRSEFADYHSNFLGFWTGFAAWANATGWQLDEIRQSIQSLGSAPAGGAGFEPFDDVPDDDDMGEGPLLSVLVDELEAEPDGLDYLPGTLDPSGSAPVWTFVIPGGSIASASWPERSFVVSWTFFEPYRTGVHMIALFGTSLYCFSLLWGAFRVSGG